MPLDTDLLVIGAGPTGLFSAYYAGFRGLRVAVVDSLPELGGQITAMYPEKQILDVAGFPTIKGRDLVEGLVDHQLLGIHHVRDDRGGPLGWDLGFLALGAALVVGGFALARPRDG